MSITAELPAKIDEIACTANGQLAWTHDTLFDALGNILGNVGIDAGIDEAANRSARFC